MSTPADPAPAANSDHFQAPDGLKLHLLSWLAPQPRAALLVVHGLGEHAGRYARTAHDLSAYGVSTFALDLRGHGRSEGERGHAERFEQLLDDVDAFRDQVEMRTAGLPRLLFGHSLGGLVVARHLEERARVQWAGAALSAPALGLHRRPPGQDLVADLLTRVAPRLRLPNGIDPEHLSHDPEAVRRYREDPLTHRWITPRLYTEMRYAMMQALGRAGRVRTPLLCLVPEGDRIVRPEDTLAFARATDAEVRRYPDWYHEPLHEVQRERAVLDLVGWIQRRIA